MHIFQIRKKLKISVTLATLILPITFAFYSSAEPFKVGSGTGDEIIVGLFPDLDLLEKSLDLLQDNIRHVGYDTDFIDEFNKELELLKDNPDLIKYVPEDIGIFNDTRMSCYESELVKTKAWTYLEEGSPIFITEGVDDRGSLTVEALAELIAQEIPHHIFGRLNCNEDFINDLGASIALGKPFRSIEATLDEVMNKWREMRKSGGLDDHSKFIGDLLKKGWHPVNPGLPIL